MSTILLCDDHRVVREALASLLRQVPGVTSVEEAGSIEEALVRCRTAQPDCVLMDLHLTGSGGIHAARRLLEEQPATRLLMMAGDASHSEQLQVLKAGAKGCLSKDVDAQGLSDALLVVLSGGELLAPTLRRAIAAHEPGPMLGLSAREQQVLRAMAQGRTNAEIGTLLWVSENTVKAHAKNLYAKAGVHQRSALVAWGFRTKVLA